MIGKVRVDLPEAEIGVHFHNDSGCAVASSLAAVGAGACQLQGCINGYGERTGNADLCSIIPDLALKMGLPVVTEEQLGALAPTAHHIAEIVNIALDPHRPYVGTSAFTHKAGLHTSALARRRGAGRTHRAGVVGNYTRMVVSEQAGKASVFHKAAELRLEMDDDLAAPLVLDRVKKQERAGYHDEAADGSFELLVRQAAGWMQPFFDLESFRTFVERRPGEEVGAEATVKLIVGDHTGHHHRRGQRLCSCPRPGAAGGASHPVPGGGRASAHRLPGQGVLDSKDGTVATVRVLLETSDGDGSWGTIGVHENVIEASWEALAEGIVVGLLRVGSDHRS